MTVMTFKGYGVNAREISIVAEHIVSFWPIDYNGNHGTCILLSNDKEINIGDWPSTVKMRLEQVQK
mgnify:CR=1 FL=1